MLGARDIAQGGPARQITIGSLYMSAQNFRGGAGDGHRFRIASLEDWAAITVFDQPNADLRLPGDRGQ